MESNYQNDPYGGRSSNQLAHEQSFKIDRSVRDSVHSGDGNAEDGPDKLGYDDYDDDDQ